MANDIQPRPVDEQPIPGDRQRADGGGESLRPEDGGLVQLRRDNTIAAVALGIQVGQAAILDVLGLGPRVLGEFREEK